MNEDEIVVQLCKESLDHLSAAHTVLTDESELGKIRLAALLIRDVQDHANMRACAALTKAGEKSRSMYGGEKS